MKINVTAIGKFQGNFPARSSEVEFAGTTLSEFMDLVRDKYGLDIAAHRNIKITHNSTLVGDLSIPLRDGDRIALIPIVAGG